MEVLTPGAGIVPKVLFCTLVWFHKEIVAYAILGYKLSLINFVISY